MDKETIQYLQKQTRSKDDLVIERHGQLFGIDKEIQPLLKTDIDCLRVNTLTSLFTYVHYMKKKEVFSDLILHVATEASVNLLSFNKNDNRLVALAACETMSEAKQRLNTMLCPATILSHLNQCYEKTEERVKLCEKLTKLKSFSEIEFEMDTVTQKIVTKKGVHIAGNDRIVNPIPLKPIFTFPEIDQPVTDMMIMITEPADIKMSVVNPDAHILNCKRKIGEYISRNIGELEITVLI